MNIKELTYYIQSANINFLIGSGASRPYLATFRMLTKKRWKCKDEKGGRLPQGLPPLLLYI